MQVRVEVFNILGQKLSTLVQAERESGIHAVEFNGTDLPSGVYFCRMQVRPVVSDGGPQSPEATGDLLFVRKLLLTK